MRRFFYGVVSRETSNLFSTESWNVRACMSYISMLNLALDEADVSSEDFSADVEI